MSSKKLEDGADSSSSLEFEQQPLTIGSTFFQKHGGRSRAPEMRKKVGSIKLSKSPTLRPPTRRAKCQSKHHVIDLSSDAASSSQSSPSSTCSDARTDHVQKPSRRIGRGSSFKLTKTLTRMSSAKFKKPLMRKFSGGREMNNMKVSTSTKPANSKSSILSRRQKKAERYQPSVMVSSDVKVSPSSSNKQFDQASKLTSESGCGNSDKARNISVYSKPNSSSSGQRSSRILTRTSSLKPLRISTKMASIKSKRSSMSKPFEVSQLPDSSIQRATCSSALKDSKFPESLKPQPGEGNSVSKVCPFTYCSLHGHRHATSPPLRRLVSIRRRSLKTQKSIKRKKQTTQMVCNGLDAVCETADGKEAISPMVEKVGEEFSLEINAGPETKPGGIGRYPHLCLNEKLDRPVSEAICLEGDTLSSNHDDGGIGSVCTELCNGESESRGKNLEVYNFATCKPPDELRRPSPDKFVETIRAYGVDSEANSTSNGADSMQLKNQKYLRMWRLMYKHTVKGSSGRVGNQLSLGEVNKAEQVEDANTLLETNNFGSCQCFSETYQDRSMENDNERNQKIELHQSDAIQLVQEAFDQILLPEIQDHSYDDHSITSGIYSDQDLSEHRHEELSTSNSTHSSKDDVLESTDKTLIGTESTKEEKTSSTVGDIPKQKTSKSWSNLKKIIILKRFFKALEKVRKLNQWKPQSLPLEHGPETEKVNLRHQTTEERKSAEEWMLDHALQQVVSKLAPAQQRRVVELVKAFETVLPFPDVKTTIWPNVTDSLQVDRVQAQVCSDMVVQSREQTSKESEAQNPAENLVGKTSPMKSDVEYSDQINDFLLMSEPQDPVESPKLKETCAGCCSIKTELDRPLSEVTDEDWKEERSVTSNIHNGNNIVILPFDQPDSIIICNNGSQLERNVSETDNITNAHGEQADTSKDMVPSDDVESVAINNVVSSASVDPFEDSMADRKEKNGDEAESGSLQGYPSLEESEPGCKTDVAEETRLEKQSYTKLWYLVYKHMVSGIAADDGTEPPDGANEHYVDYVNTLPGRVSCEQSLPETNQDTIRKDNIAGSHNVNLRRIEAIKLVEKAIDDILLPENTSNSPDDQSSTCSRESSEEEVENSVVPEPEDKWLGSKNITIHEEQENVPQEGQKPNQKTPKGWSNLKKLILLKRFINALEKVRKFTPKGPRYLPLEADEEAEKVNLKHQNIDERKCAEEWMLDYALQRAISRLTPARKRKVELLVEAFETVTPTIGDFYYPRPPQVIDPAGNPPQKLAVLSQPRPQKNDVDHHDELVHVQVQPTKAKLLKLLSATSPPSIIPKTSHHVDKITNPFA
ncbi:hypothetical protein FNV43_RR16400 [Rhamnella rubrinervis]|uniref:Calmodulin-binding domain-containing protein n=1 Tax=Rhamnella rubrinervis TaxID=2594499 RepID=A0A8K0GYQ2_9ROSA|nr:hypothetical protein FNV43_RR16400 [Rhamnella rubrinervis]